MTLNMIRYVMMEISICDSYSIFANGWMDGVEFNAPLDTV